MHGEVEELYGANEDTIRQTWTAIRSPVPLNGWGQYDRFPSILVQHHPVAGAIVEVLSE